MTRVVSTTDVTKNAYEANCQLADAAGVPRPNFVDWGRVYTLPDGRKLRMVAGFADTGRRDYEDDRGRARRLPKGDTFHTLTARIEEIEL